MILVTGGTGLLGSHLLFHLLKSNDRIRAIYREEKSLIRVREVFSYYCSNSEELFNKIDWVKADILDIPSLNSAFENILYVYHSAAMVSFDSRKDEKMKDVNIIGTANIVNLCLAHNVEKLCHVSSISTLSTPIDRSTISENDYWNPEVRNSGYAISKNGAEMEVWRGVEEGLNAVIVNPSIIIGPGFWETSSGKFFSMIRKGMKFYTGGSSGFVGVDDVSIFMIKLMNSGLSGNRYILNSENLSYKDLFKEIASNLGVKPPSIKAKKWMLYSIWILDTIKSKIFRTEQRLNKDSLLSSLNDKSYSNNKICEALEVSFKPMSIVIKETSIKFSS